MQIQDSKVSNFNYNPSVKSDIVATMKYVHQRMLDRIKEVAELEKTHELTQVWLMSKEQYETLPENPTWYDYMAAGAIPQGYMWVKGKIIKMSNSIPRLLAAKAGAWWAGQLHCLPDNNAGNSLLNFALNVDRQQIEPLSGQQITDYQKALIAALESTEFTSMLSNLSDLPATIGVDYQPDLILKVIAKSVGIDDIEKRLPVKTIMCIYEDHIEVSKGYGAPWETI